MKNKNKLNKSVNCKELLVLLDYLQEKQLIHS